MSQTRLNNQQHNVEYTLQASQFEALRDILARYGGVYLDETNQRTLSAGVSQRMAVTGLSFGAYMAHIGQTTGRAELHQLCELVLNHETVFFRNQPHMRAMREVIFPKLHRRKSAGTPLRIWSAGCSTGEEPYSLAIVAMQSLGRVLPRPVHIWATDLSEAALMKARLGTYHGRTLSNVTPEMRKHYFVFRGNDWAVQDDVRALVTFEQCNLLDPFPEKIRGVDVIFCQNVTIYFDLETFRNLIDRFYNILPEGGMLFLGFSETLWNIYDKFRLHEIAGAFVYVKEPQQPVLPVQDAVPVSGRAAAGSKGDGAARRDTPAFRATARRAERPPGSAPAPAPGVLPPSQASGMAIVQRAHELLDAGQAQEVLDMLNQVPLEGMHAPQMLALMAKAHANRGEPDLAVAEARRALELNSLTTEAYVLLGVLYAQQGQAQVAARHLERARYLEPGSALISFYLADVYRQLQRRDHALREYRNTLRKLAAYSPDTLLDGVAVGWLRETCERYLKLLA